MSRRLVRAAAAFALVLLPRLVAGQGNYKLAPVGGRTTLVGGTGLAYGRDSASAFLNPATIVRIDPGRLAFSVNFYSFSVVTADRWYQPGPSDSRFAGLPSAHDGDTSLNSSIATVDFDTLPGSLCVFLAVSDLSFITGKHRGPGELQSRLGLCLASIHSSVYSFNAEDYQREFASGRTRQAGSIRQTFRRFAIGPTYATQIDEHLTVGASLHFSRASLRSTNGNTAYTQINGGEPISSVFYKTSRGDSHDLTFSAGATYRMNHQTLAFTVETPSVHFFGDGGTNLYTHSDGPVTATFSEAGTGTFTANTPLRIAVGTGYEASRGSVELNFSYHAPLARVYEAELSGSRYVSNGGGSADELVRVERSTGSRGALNVGIGGELFLSPKDSLLAGLSTDFSAVRGQGLTRDPFGYYPSITNRVSASLGYGSHGSTGDLLLGGELSYAWGDRLAVDAYQLPPRLEATPEQQYVLLLVLAGSTSFKAIKHAVEDVTKALDPTQLLKKQAPPTTKP